MKKATGSSYRFGDGSLGSTKLRFFENWYK